MPLSYNPKDAKDGPSPGDYPFTVTQATEMRFNSGNQGLELTIEFHTPERILTTWCRYSYTPGGLPYLRKMCEGLGLNFDQPPEAQDFVRRGGTAFFAKDEKGSLKPTVIHPKSGSMAPKASAVVAEDVPF